MSLNNHRIYSNAHYFLQVGRKHVVSTELQILNCKDDGKWFGDKHLSTVVGNLEGELMARIDRTENDTDLQIIEDDSLLMVYKFRHTGTKEAVLLHKNQMEVMGLTEKVTNYGDGDYTHFILFPQKLTVTVSLVEQSEELLNLTEANLEADDLGSKYFNDLKKNTNSEMRRKETLKKIWNTRKNLKSQQKSPTNTSTPVLTSHNEKKEKCTMSSFKSKISAFQHEKVNTKIPAAESSENTPSCSRDQTQTKILDFCAVSSKENRSPSPIITGPSPADKEDIDTSPHLVETSQQQKEEDTNTNSIVIEITENPCSDSQELLPHEKTKDSNALPSKKGNACKQLSEKKKLKKLFNEKTKTKKLGDTTDTDNNADTHNDFDEQFSDSDDFLSNKVTKRKKRQVIKVRYSKPKLKKKGQRATLGTIDDIKTKGGPVEKKSKCDSPENSDDSDLEELPLSGGNKKTKEVENDETITGTISMDDLIKAKNVDKTLAPLNEIDTLLAENTIDLEEYGNVSLEDLGNVEDLSVENVRDLVREMEGQLRDILNGQTECERHKLYKGGGRGKGALSMQVAFGLFSEEQEESITKTLVDIFCSRKSKYFDYTMKVLLPETMAMLYAKVKKISRADANKLIMERC